jgi:hypothetical protein
MSNYRYLEVDSRFRDRTLWPQPSNFDIPISQTGRKGFMEALDPVSKAATIINWTSNRFNNLLINGHTLTVTVNIDIPNNPGVYGDNTIIVVEAPSGEMQTVNDYYCGAIFSSISVSAKRRIVNYEFIGSNGIYDRAIFTVDSAFANGVAISGETFAIIDPTNIPTSIGSSPIFFIPGPLIGNNVLVNRIIYNETLDQSRPLLVYNKETATVQLDITGSSISERLKGPVNWTLSDSYSIRILTPILQTQLNGDPANNPSTKNSFNLPSTVSYPTDNLIGSFLEYLPPQPTPSRLTGTVSTTLNTITLGGSDPNTTVTGNSLNDFYVDMNIRILDGSPTGIGEIRTIISYNKTTNIATVDRDFSILPTAVTTYTLFFPSENSHQARRITKWVNFSGTGVFTNGSLDIQFPSTASDITGYYNNLYITLPVATEYRMINSYVVNKDSNGKIISRIATIYNLFSNTAIPNNIFTITSGITTPFTFSISQSNTVNPAIVKQIFSILPFSNDNLVPFVYSGSMVSQQEMVCYEIELINLILPNITLGTSFGSLISFYQYVYVELQNVSTTGAGTTNIIYSNNPHSSKMLFRCPIKDVPNPINSTFIKIDGNGMKQTIKFKPNDNLHFSVHMSTGELFKNLKPEIYGPNYPDPVTQISACFSMKRI